MAGYDDENKECEMYVLDYLASMVKAPFAAHGYGGFFTTSIMDREYRKDMSETEAYELMKACVKEVHKRLIINLPNFQVQVVDKEGIKNLDDIKEEVEMNDLTPDAYPDHDEEVDSDPELRNLEGKCS